MDATNDTDCESDREIACPVKRRRQDTTLLSLPPEDEYQSLSRSSSLLQFETLEKQCQETSSSSPSVYSQFSLDSLEPKRVPEPPPHTDDCPSSLKTWHSFDSLPSHTAPRPAPNKISAENLSEDSGYSDHTTVRHNVVRRRLTTATFNAYDHCEGFRRMSGDFGASCQNLTAVDGGGGGGGGGYVNIAVVECRRRRAKYSGTSASEPDLAHHLHSGGGAVEVSCAGGGGVCSSVPKNLDLLGKEDEENCVGTSVAAKNWDLGDFAEMASYKREGSYAEAMTNRVDLSDDEHSLCYKRKPPKTAITEFDRKILDAISESVQSINSGSIADNYLSNIYSTPPPLEQAKRTVASTPNLVMNVQEQERFMTMLMDDDRRRSVQDIPRKSSLVNHSTSTSCMSDLEDHGRNYESGSTKGVHFSPVVSEVNWPEDSQSTPSTAERESSYSLSSTPERDDSLDTLTKSLMEPSFPALGSRPFHSQPDVRGVRRRGSQLIKRDGDGCVIKAYVDGDGIQYRHTHLDLERGGGGSGGEPALLSSSSTAVPPTVGSHVVGASVEGGRGDAVAAMEAVDVPRKEQQQQKNVQQQQHRSGGGGGKLGGFFSRLASFRFSTRKDDKAKAKKKQAANRKTDGSVQQQQQQKVATKADYIYIPLKGPLPGGGGGGGGVVPPIPPVSSKPPLPRAPPRVVGASVKRGDSAQGRHGGGGGDPTENHRRRRTIDSGESCPRPMEPMGLIETDLDTEVTVITSSNVVGGGAAAANVKTRSLLNLGAEPRLGALLNVADPAAQGRRDGDGAHSKLPAARPHKSMEFLLDKQNLKVVEPPENELQKGERVMSEHQLRVQRSLQKLTVPEWYKPSQVPREGFLLKKNRESRWTGTTTTGAGSKTTSLSSLGSGGAGSPSILSPSSQPFVRWSTSKLNSTASSPCASTRSSFATRQPNGSVSPSSVRSSFSYRQPYLGWRSQERLNKPRTPAERLANSILQQQQQHHHHHQQRGHQVQESPEIQTSIKEVTSAIVHYVSGLRPEGGGEEDGAERSRSASPRGSQKLCWLESSFVGIRPLDSPQTPVSLTESGHSPAPPSSLRLDLQTHNDVTLLNTGSGPRPSPGSTTLEDVLDSLLGLPSSDRAPSPSLQVTASANTSPNRLVLPDHFRRRSEGSEPAPATSTTPVSSGGGSRRVSFQACPVLQCRYSRCAKVVAASSPEAAAFKNCHNCSYTYCSRACRRAHWEKHRKTCLFSRIGTLCRQVIAAVKEQRDTLRHLSLIARRGYLSHGPGAVKCFFPCPDSADRFLSNGLPCLGELTYVPWPDLLPSEMGPQLYSELVQMCKGYNPDSKLVLYVSVCVVSETPATGAVKWERQLVSRCAKMRLSKDLHLPADSVQDNPPETLILTCTSIDDTTAQARQLKEMTVSNVQEQLRRRGVSLRRQHPVIFRQLCAYADGSCDKFTPITVYPKDSATGKSFMCIIMLEADPDSLRQVESAAVKVRTVDVLCAD